VDRQLPIGQGCEFRINHTLAFFFAISAAFLCVLSGQEPLAADNAKNCRKGRKEKLAGPRRHATAL
jgi:hypothetical protein